MLQSWESGRRACYNYNLKYGQTENNWAKFAQTSENAGLTSSQNADPYSTDTAEAYVSELDA
jgi:hypothetical protein